MAIATVTDRSFVSPPEILSLDRRTHVFPANLAALKAQSSAIYDKPSPPIVDRLDLSPTAREWWTALADDLIDRESELDAIAEADRLEAAFGPPSGQAHPDCDPDELIAAVGERTYRAILAEEGGPRW